MGGHVPAGYHAITPYFSVSDADRLIAFLTDVFAGHVLMEDRFDNGCVRHARVGIGDSIVMLNEAGDDDAATRAPTPGGSLGEQMTLPTVESLRDF